MKVLLKAVAYIFLLVLTFASCRKDIKQTEDPAVRSSKIDNNSHSKHTRDYSSEVATKWMDMQLRIMKTTPLPIALANSKCLRNAHECVEGGSWNEGFIETICHI